MERLLALLTLSLGLLAVTEETLPSLPAPAQYGMLGIAVAVLASGRVVVPVGWLRDEKAARQRAEERAERAEQEIKRLNDALQVTVGQLLETVQQELGSFDDR